MGPQRRDNDPSVRLKKANKIGKLVARSYITEGVILALQSFFYVTMGTDDTRMVFDATVIGLNDSMWDTNFMLPSIGSFLMMVGPETHMVDIYVGEMFYNFRLSSVLAKYCGVDLGSYLGHNKDHQGTTLCMIWVKLMMGLVFYPYAEI